LFDPNEDTTRQEILKRLRKYRSQVAEYWSCKDVYEAMFPSCTSVISDMPKTKSDESVTERWAQKRMDYKQQLNQSLSDMMDAIKETDRLIDVLDGYEKVVIERRYKLGETMDKIATNAGYVERQCYRLHDKAIRKLVQHELQKTG
jgi:DNA-directed RNA polymerase specialized sigma subunit